MKIVSRSEWGARPPERVTLRKPSQLKGVVQHWFGIPKAAKNHKDCPALVKSVQAAHQKGEFNDIAYNHLVCLHGVVFEGRGFGIQTGANGNSVVNREYAAVCAMIGKGDKPSGEMLVGLSEIIQEWRAKGAGKAVRTHGSITGSECPGPDLTRWVEAKGYEKHLPKPKPAGDPPLPGPSPKPPWFWEAVKEFNRRRNRGAS